MTAHTHFTDNTEYHDSLTVDLETDFFAYLLVPLSVVISIQVPRCAGRTMMPTLTRVITRRLNLLPSKVRAGPSFLVYSATYRVTQP